MCVLWRLLSSNILFYRLAYKDDFQALLTKDSNFSDEHIQKLVDQMEPDRKGLINYTKYVETVLA